MNTNFFHLKNINGKDWLINPEGNPFISKGVTTIYWGMGQAWKSEKCPYHEAIKKQYNHREIWSKSVEKRLKKWGFNSLGAWCYDSDLRQNFPYTEMLNIAWTAGQDDVWVTGGFPDVFSKEFEAIADKICKETCLAKRDEPFLIGYFLDNELRWGPDWRSDESILESYLQLSPGSAGRARSEEYLQDKKICMDNETDEASKRFLRQVAKQYFSVCYRAIRKYDSNHLILGCRFGEVPQEENYIPTPKEVIEEMIPYVDVFSYNCYFLIKDRQNKQEFQSIIQNYTSLSGKPVMITEFSFLGADAGYPTEWTEENKYPKPGILEVMVENQKERAEAAKRYTRALMEIPQTIGYHWFQYADYPYEGRANDGVGANYGLVKINDEPWEELAKALSNINKQAEKIHAG